MINAQKIRVELGERAYDIVIGNKILGRLGSRLKEFDFSRKIAVVSNPVVFKLYGRLVLKSLKAAGFNAEAIIIPDGEEYKDNLWAYHIHTRLLELRLDRNSALIALGGGVIGDITGFVASTYMRGISYIQVPTTLLSQVDSSVGGKTGINHRLGKNMIGTFYQPRLVWIDTETLKTLPEREFLSGMAEVIKYGVIHDRGFFEFLNKNRDAVLMLDRKALTHIIKLSCKTKADIVSEDERELGLRAILNYGHTIGHALEAATEYREYLHGEAVSIGMCLEALLSSRLGLLNDMQNKKIKALVMSYRLPAGLPPDIEIKPVLSSMQLDKKVFKGDIRFILPIKIGAVRIQDGIPAEKIKAVLKAS